jgi:hypothetical protein
MSDINVCYGEASRERRRIQVENSEKKCRPCQHDKSIIGADLADAFQKTSMLGKVISAWLVFLTLTPFTAPFPTCDLTIFLTGHAPAPVHGTSQSASVTDATLSQALPLVRPSGRVRFVAISESRATSYEVVLRAAAFAQSLRPTSSCPLPVSLPILRI